MLIVKPHPMFLTGETWHQVVDETGALLGGLTTPQAAQNYKARLERAGIQTAEALLARIPDPARRETMRSLMCSTI